MREYLVTRHAYVRKEELADIIDAFECADTDADKMRAMSRLNNLVNTADEIEVEIEEPEIKPILASDLADYEFKRHMCDLFETGYHVDSMELLMMFAKRLKLDYLL